VIPLSTDVIERFCGGRITKKCYNIYIYIYIYIYTTARIYLYPGESASFTSLLGYTPFYCTSLGLLNKYTNKDTMLINGLCLIFKTIECFTLFSYIIMVEMGNGR